MGEPEKTDVFVAVRWPSVNLQFSDGDTYIDTADRTQRFPKDDPALTDPVQGRFGRPLREASETIRQIIGSDVTIEPHSEGSVYVRGVSPEQAQKIKTALDQVRSLNREQMWHVAKC